MFRSSVCIVVLVWASAGCYTYAPIDARAVTPSMAVRVDSDAGLGSERERVEGEVFEVSQGSFSVLPEVGRGVDTGPRVYRFTDAVSVTRRTLDTGRTLAVAGVSAAVGVGALLLAKGDPGDTRTRPGGGDFDLIPILRALLHP